MFANEENCFDLACAASSHAFENFSAKTMANKYGDNHKQLLHCSNGLSYIIRAHEATASGIKLSKGAKVFTGQLIRMLQYISSSVVCATVVLIILLAFNSLQFFRRRKIIIVARMPLADVFLWMMGRSCPSIAPQSTKNEQAMLTTRCLQKDQSSKRNRQRYSIFNGCVAIYY